MQTATADPLVGRLLEGRYRILDRIARGGMSTVYSAVDERLDRLVAVKVMSSALSADPAFSDRFTREARAAARLTHVNAVAVFDQGFDSSDGGHHVFLVMELVTGRTLRELMRERNGTFSPAEAVSIMEPVLSALSGAHRAGLVHRDVKPENILLSDDGLVKVADFGLARAVDTDAAATRTGLMMGTVAYCSPEQITRGHADQRSDVYAAGILLFELLTGRPPFRGDSAMNIAYQHVHHRVPAPSSRVKGIPTELDEVVVAATDSDPTGRPADASAMLAELADVRTQLGLPVVPVPARPRPSGRSTGDTGATPRRSSGARTQQLHTAPVTGRGAHRGADRTDVLRDGSRGRHDTTVVPQRGQPRADAPPPPVVIPPRRPLSPEARRRRRTLIILVSVVLLGLAAGLGGWAATTWYRSWNTHIPQLANHSAAQARAQLERIGYDVDPTVSNQFSDSVGKGKVIRTDPAAGTRLQQGKTVRLVVSLGRQRFTVPATAGQSVESAEAALKQRVPAVDYTVRLRPSAHVPNNKVIRTSPASGKRVPRGTSVTIYVSSGPPTVDVPSIDSGTPFDQAQHTLQHAKFRVRERREYSDQVDAGGVIAVDPSGRAELGSAVTVTVSRGPQYVPMPDIARFSPYDKAAAQLEQLGLHAQKQVVYGDGSFGKVIGVQAQDGTPLQAGTQVQVGSTIVLLVV